MELCGTHTTFLPQAQRFPESSKSSPMKANVNVVPSNGDDIQDLDEQELVLMQQLEQTQQALAAQKSGGDPTHAFLKFEENPTPASYFEAVQSGARLSASSPSPSLPISTTPMRASTPASSSAMSPSRGSDVDMNEGVQELPPFDLRERAPQPVAFSSPSASKHSSQAARIDSSFPLAHLEVVNLADAAARSTELPALDFGSPTSSVGSTIAVAAEVALPPLSLCASTRGNATMASQQFSTSFATSFATADASSASQQRQHRPQSLNTHIDLLTPGTQSAVRVLTPKKEHIFVHTHQNQVSNMHQAREVPPKPSFLQLSPSSSSFDIAQQVPATSVGQYHISHEDARRLAALALEPTSSQMIATTAADIASLTAQSLSMATAASSSTYMPLTAQSLSALNEQVLLEAQRHQQEQDVVAIAHAIFPTPQGSASGDAARMASRTRSPSPPTSASPNLSRSPSRGSLASSLSSTRTVHSPLMSHSSPMSSHNSPISAAGVAASQAAHAQMRAYSLASMAPLSLESQCTGSSGIPSINNTDHGAQAKVIAGLGDTPTAAQFNAILAQRQAHSLAQVQAQARHFTFSCPNNVTLTSANVAIPTSVIPQGGSPLTAPLTRSPPQIVKLEDFQSVSSGSSTAASVMRESVLLHQLRQQHNTLDLTNEIIKLEQNLMRRSSPSHSHCQHGHQHSHDHVHSHAPQSQSPPAATAAAACPAPVDDNASDMCTASGVLRNLCSTCCVQCRKHFKTVSNRNKHLATAQVHSASKSYRCTVCKNYYQTKQSLKTHMKRHERKMYACECNAQFFTKGELRRHKLSHSKVKKYACEMCGKRYPLKQHVTRHMRKIHAELAPMKRKRAKPNTVVATSPDAHDARGADAAGATGSDSDSDATILAAVSDAEAFLNGTLHMGLGPDAEAAGDAGDSNVSSPAASPKHSLLFM